MIRLSKNQVILLHARLIECTGGSDGIVKNHPMVDGNKRLGTHVMLVFLALNGYELSYTQKELSDTILDLASGIIGSEDILRLIISHQK